MPETSASSPGPGAHRAHVSRPALAALSLLAALAAGCGGGSGSTAPPAAHPVTKAPAAPAVDPGIATANRTMAAGVPMGDGTAPVEARFDLVSVPGPGEAFLVHVAVLPAAPAPVLRVDIMPSQGVTVLAPDAPLTFEKVAAGSVVPFDVRAQSPEAGARVLSVKVTLDLPDGPQSRVFAFPVLVGAPPAQSPAPTPAKAAAKPKTH
jgi:hypothetical protein